METLLDGSQANSCSPFDFYASSYEWFPVRNPATPATTVSTKIGRQLRGLGDLYVRCVGSKAIEHGRRRHFQLMGTGPHRGGPSPSVTPLRPCHLLPSSENKQLSLLLRQLDSTHGDTSASNHIVDSVAFDDPNNSAAAPYGLFGHRKFVHGPRSIFNCFVGSESSCQH